MKTTALLIVSLLFISSFPMQASHLKPLAESTLPAKQKTWSFENNEGQLLDPSGKDLSDIEYFGQYAGVQVYCETGKLSFVFIKKDPGKNESPNSLFASRKFSKINPASISASRMEMVFAGANPDVNIIARGQSDLKKNYFKNGKSISGVYSVKTLYYVNLYNHIDMELITNENGLEYSFIVHPGGNVADIKIERKGIDHIDMLDDGGISYKNAIGAITESSPFAYSGRREETKSSFTISKNNTTSFKIENYDHDNDLVIDPDLSWATYIGGNNDDAAESVVMDASGNVYVSGYSISSGIATSGAYQTTIAGGGFRYDAIVSKFDDLGTLKWATYFGGDSNDISFDIAIDAKNAIYITGYTNSPNGIATSGAFQTSLGSTDGYQDAFLAKFNNSGILQWSTYIGGPLDDYGYSVATDAANNVYITGSTTGSTGIASSGALQTAYGGGAGDAIIVKFNSNGKRLWATYYGGIDDDGGYGIATDKAKNVYLTGFTLSSKGIATSGTHKSVVDSFGGNAFLAAFDSTGTRKWGSYYGGNSGDGDAGYNIATDGASNIYITGYTASTSGIASTGASQTNLKGGSSAYLASFSTAGSLNWATYFGGPYYDAGQDVTTDSDGNIYLAGYASSGSGIATSGAYKTSIGSQNTPDAFMAKFNSSGVLKYATYFGGDGVDLGLGIAADNTGNVYIAGRTASTNNIGSAGSYQSAFGGGNDDGFIAKFFLCSLSSSAFGTKSVCQDDTGYYKATDHANTSFAWKVSGGTVLSGLGTDSIAVKWTTKNGAGSVVVKEVSIGGCVDSVIMPVTVNTLPTPGITGDLFLCQGGIGRYHTFSIPGNTYKWTITGGHSLTNPSLDSSMIQFPNGGKTALLVVEETTGKGCKNHDTANITLNPLPDAKFTIADDGKGNYTFTSVDSATLTKGMWMVDGKPFTGFSVKHSFLHTGSFDIIFSVTNSNGCTGVSDTFLNPLHTGINPGTTSALGLKIYPNPFVHTTELKYTLGKQARIQITVSDILGREILKLEDKTMPAGENTIATGNKIEMLEPGTYFIKLQVEDAVVIQKIIKMAE